MDKTYYQDFNNNFRLRGVYKTLDKLIAPENILKNNEARFPNIRKMLQDIVDSKENFLQCKRKLHRLKVNFVFYTNCGENEGTQTLESTQNALNIKDSRNVSYEEQVSKNLFAAINYLEDRNFGADKGLLDVEECIQDTHNVLMKNLLKQNKCGEFSTNRRVTSDGHVYPEFGTKEDAYDAVLHIVDQYNATIEYIKNAGLTPIKQNFMYIQCAAWILYNFVTLHPFADGNGRMCRLLASHCLYLVFPFPCPLYNIHAPTDKDYFLNAIKKARSHNGENLDDLVTLLIESGWQTYKYLKEFG